jgi:ABC-type amino acid transport substrate-binding protein
MPNKIRRLLPYLSVLVISVMMPSQPVLATLPNVNLTPQEKAYIEQVGSIKMCVDPDWVPFEHINKQGQHEGIAADLVQLATQRVGLKIELYPTKNWDESLAAAKRGRCQIMSFLNKTPAREVWLIFTEPLFSTRTSLSPVKSTPILVIL